MSAIDAAKLQDFFMFYDDRNPKHVEAVNILWEAAQQVMDDAHAWIEKFREEYEAPEPPEGGGNTPSESERENDFDPNKPINWSVWGSHITENFTVGELLQYDRRRIPREQVIKDRIINVCKNIEVIRADYSTQKGQEIPITFTSGYRPRSVNRAVGGARNSQHITGNAGDFKPLIGSVKELQDFCEAHPIFANAGLGRGHHKGFVHGDFRGSRARWNY